MISGLGFHKISDWSFDHRYKINLEPDKIKHNDFVFVNLDELNDFVNILNKNPPKNKFNLITHNSDQTFYHNHFEKVKDYTLKVYALNCSYKNEDIYPIPIGFRDVPLNTMEIINQIPIKHLDKNILLYMNFDVNTNRKIRQPCYEYFINKKWVIKENNISIKEFYNNMMKSKYVLSPRGCGIDCHRIYESIYFNAIPILLTTEFDYFYKHLPVVIVKEWDKITEEFLINNYNTYYNNLIMWKYNNSEWLKPKFWLEKDFR
jgi:hypothetical protein